MHAGAFEVNVLAGRHDRGIRTAVSRGPLQRIRQRLPTAFVRAAAALLDGNIELIREKSGQIGGRKRLQTGIIKRLDGIHIIIRHLARCIHRHAAERQRTRALHLVKAGLGDFRVSVTEHARGRCHVIRAAFGFAVKQPERHINAAQLLDMVIIAEQLGQQQLSLVMLLERGNRILLAQLERQYVVRLENAAELLGNDGRVAAVRARGRRCGLLADQLRTAGRTAVYAHLVRICAPVLICEGLPFTGVAPRLRLRRGLLFLFGVQLFDLCRVK